MSKKIFTNHAVLAAAERAASSGYTSFINASSEETVLKTFSVEEDVIVPAKEPEHKKKGK